MATGNFVGHRPVLTKSLWKRCFQEEFLKGKWPLLSFSCKEYPRSLAQSPPLYSADIPLFSAKASQFMANVLTTDCTLLLQYLLSSELTPSFVHTLEFRNVIPLFQMSYFCLDIFFTLKIVLSLIAEFIIFLCNQIWRKAIVKIMVKLYPSW